MRSPRSALLLVPVLLAGAMPARAQVPSCQAGAPRLELSATQQPPPELCIHPGRFTTFLFDGPLVTGAVVLEGRTHFRAVEASGRSLVLVPSERLPPGARLSLEVRFGEGPEPQSARFTLVAHPREAAQQVEVSVARPAVNDCASQAQRLTAELEQCQAQVASLAARTGPPFLLLGALASGALDRAGLSVHAFEPREFSQSPGGELKVQRLSFYRARHVMTLEVALKNEDTQRPWALQGATLLGRNGEEHVTATVHPNTPLAPGATELRWVEWRLSALPEEPASYTLKLWEAGRTRTAAVPGLKLR